MTTPNATTPKLIYHLMPVAEAAAEAGLSTKLFLVAAAAGQLGNVEILQIGTSQYVRGSSLFDFLEGKRNHSEVTDRDLRMPQYRDAKVEDYERLPDGTIARRASICVDLFAAEVRA